MIKAFKLTLPHVFGFHTEREPISFLMQGIDGGSVMMLAVHFC